MHRKRIMVSLILVLLLITCLVPCESVRAEENEPSSTQLSLECESAVLMEPLSGKIIYEKDKDKPLAPASVTKVMTLLLAFEAIDSGKIKYDDLVQVSAHAASMGGSQVFLEEGETQTVDTMLKCVAVSSANDAAVSLAEHIAGSEETFVKKMNHKAKQLGMNHTHFVNCCGLDAKDHVTTAYDIALMSRELMVRHPDVFRYTTIWMDTFTHKTAKETKEFGLANTNKLIRHYEGATGLKTGSTSKAKFCLSATARRNDMDMLAVIMAAKDAKSRVREASKLLDYGFSNCKLYRSNIKLKKKTLPVQNGKKETVSLQKPKLFRYVQVNAEQSQKIKAKIKYQKDILAPVKKGQVLGQIDYFLNKEKIGSQKIRAKNKVEKWNFKDCFGKIVLRYLLQS